MDLLHNYLIFFAVIHHLNLEIVSSDKISCPEINFPNGRARLRSKGRLVNFKCKRSFERVGVRFAVCLDSGQWSQQIPTCVGTTCTKPAPVPNLIVQELYKGGVLKFMCGAGLSRVGPETLMCDGNMWNDELPKCVVGTTLECDFEHAGLCGWSHDFDDNFDWTWNKGETPTAQTGPRFDHTTNSSEGHYLYMESSAPQTSGQKTRILSPTYAPENMINMCLEFFYHMFGPEADGEVGNLDVYVKPLSIMSTSLGQEYNIFHLSGNHGDEWLRGEAKIPQMSEIFQIVFQATRLRSWSGDIAIDDVRIHSCIEEIPIDQDTSDNEGDEDGIDDNAESSVQKRTTKRAVLTTQVTRSATKLTTKPSTSPTIAPSTSTTSASATKIKVIPTSTSVPSASSLKTTTVMPTTNTSTQKTTSLPITPKTTKKTTITTTTATPKSTSTPKVSTSTTAMPTTTASTITSSVTPTFFTTTTPKTIKTTMLSTPKTTILTTKLTSTPITTSVSTSTISTITTTPETTTASTPGTSATSTFVTIVSTATKSLIATTNTSTTEPTSPASTTAITDKSRTTAISLDAKTTLTGTTSDFTTLTDEEQFTSIFPSPDNENVDDHDETDTNNADNYDHHNNTNRDGVNDTDDVDDDSRGNDDDDDENSEEDTGTKSPYYIDYDTTNVTSEDSDFNNSSFNNSSTMHSTNHSQDTTRGHEEATSSSHEKTDKANSHDNLKHGGVKEHDPNSSSSTNEMLPLIVGVAAAVFVAAVVISVLAYMWSRSQKRKQKDQEDQMNIITEYVETNLSI